MGAERQHLKKSIFTETSVREAEAINNSSLIVDMKIEVLKPKAAETRVYQFGVRIDAQCHEKSACRRVHELRFPTKNGVGVKEVFEGNHPMVSIGSAAAGRRSYSRFRFRVAGESGPDITGTVYVHRPIPEYGRIKCVRLVEQRIGNNRKHYLQFVVTDLKTAEDATIAGRKPLAVLYFGQYYENSGNRIAGFADGAHPSSAHILSLPPEIESMIIHSEAIKSERDQRRYELLNKLATCTCNDIPGELSEQLALIRRLPVRHTTSSRLARLIPDRKNGSHRLRHDIYTLLDIWRRQDKLLLQAESHLANRARNRKKKYYEKLALSIAREYEYIAIASSDIAESAKMKDRTFGKYYRPGGIAGAGRGKAVRNDFQETVINAASRLSTRVIKMQGCISNLCPLCGAGTITESPGSRPIYCTSCGEKIDWEIFTPVAVWKEAMTKLADIDDRCLQESSHTSAAKAEKKASSPTPFDTITSDEKRRCLTI